MAEDLKSILPMLIVAGTACVILLGDVFVWRKNKGVNAWVAIIGVLWAFVATLQRSMTVGEDHGTVFAGSVSIDSLAHAGNVALLITALLSILLAWTYLRNRGLDHGEYYALLMFSVSGAMLMASAQDLIVLFLGLEVLSFALYVLAGFARTEERSEESSIKYFLLGAFASAFLLYGIALIYGATQTTNLGELEKLLAAGGGKSMMMAAGIGLLLVGLGFKAAVIPFHQWTPDVYEGAPTSVTAYMAAGAKIGAFAALIRVCAALAPLAPFWLDAVRVLAILTMVFGNLLAIQQTNVKRMLAYSSIAHAGYLLVAICAIGHRGTGVNPSEAFSTGVTGAVFYLFAYVFMTLGAFGVLVYLSGRARDYQNLNDLRGLARTHPGAAYAMVFFMLSLGGIPPTMGFMGKWQIFMAALRGGELTLAIVMALASVLAVYYYLKIVWMVAFDEPAEAAPEPPIARGGAASAVYLSAIATLLFGIVPFLLNTFTEVWQQTYK